MKAVEKPQDADSDSPQSVEVKRPEAPRGVLKLAQTTTNDQVVRVRTNELAALIKAAVGRRQILEEKLEDEALRLYAAFEEGKPVGWVRSIQGPHNSRWVSNLYVDAAHRRKGLGSALMNAMLADDQHSGADYSVLLASKVGSKLYPTLGYEQIGLLQLFAPPRLSGA
jgi:predicted N-acetyltransferase YhbS